MHTCNHRPVRVYLHPAAATSIIAVRAIEAITGRIAYVRPSDRRVHLITPHEHMQLHSHLKPGGAAC